MDSGTNWLSLNWGKPHHRGAAPIMAYKVECWQKAGEGARWSELGISGLNSFDAFNLKPGAEYQFRITPRNRHGYGESITSEVITVGKKNDLPEFPVLLPNQQKALKGDTITLECILEGTPAPCVRWFRDNTELVLEGDARYEIEQKDNRCTLVIRDLQEKDNGRFLCEATNTRGRVSTFCRVFVVTDPKILEADRKLKETLIGKGEDPPQFTMRLRNRRVEVNFPVRLTVQVIGNPEPEITWMRNGKIIGESTRHAFFKDDKFHTLEISKTTIDDSGTYSVVGSNIFGSISCRSRLVVDKGIKDYLAPAFHGEMDPQLSTLKEGEELRLSAQVEAYPSVGVMWYRDGVKLRPSRRAVMTISHSGRIELALGAVLPSDSGVYTCVATNEVGRSELSAKVDVIPCNAPMPYVDNQISTASSNNLPYSKEPKFLKKPRSTTAFEGDTIVILCEVIGDPKPEVLWFRDFLKVS